MDSFKTTPLGMVCQFVENELAERPAEQVSITLPPATYNKVFTQAQDLLGQDEDAPLAFDYMCETTVYVGCH